MRVILLLVILIVLQLFITDDFLIGQYDVQIRQVGNIYMNHILFDYFSNGPDATIMSNYQILTLWDEYKSYYSEHFFRDKNVTLEVIKLENAGYLLVTNYGINQEMANWLDSQYILHKTKDFWFIKLE